VNLYQIVIDMPLKEEVRFEWRYAETTRQALESAIRMDTDKNNIVIGIIDEDGVYIRTEHLIEKQDND
jgi:tRNA threonylcarbamoyladenosine modification (KEOPS) complex  Pcc1 subunit